MNPLLITIAVLYLIAGMNEAVNYNWLLFIVYTSLVFVNVAMAFVK